MIPFAVVGSDHEYQVNGKRILGRKTKWGTIEGIGCCAVHSVEAVVRPGPSPIALWVPVPSLLVRMLAVGCTSRAPGSLNLMALSDFVTLPHILRAGALGFPGVQHPRWDGSRAFPFSSFCSSTLLE